MEDTSKIFEEKGYIKVESLVDPKIAEYMSKQLEFLSTIDKSIELGNDAPDGDNTILNDIEYFGYCVPLLDHLLLGLRERIGAVVGKNLLPTYSYFRKYKKGNVLQRHTDRPSCEISCTLCLGQSDIWPFYAGDSGPIEMNPGDAVLYKGIDVVHWRDELEGEFVTQTFLHYVDSDGPYKNWFMDRRGDVYNIGKELNLY